MRRHLAGDAHQRDRIHQSVGQAGDRIGGTRTRGHQHAAHLAGGTRIAFGRMHGSLLVADENVAKLVLLEDRIIDRQNRTAGIAEQGICPLIDHGLHHHFRAGHLLGRHRLVPWGFRISPGLSGLGTRSLCFRQ